MSVRSRKKSDVLSERLAAQKSALESMEARLATQENALRAIESELQDKDREIQTLEPELRRKELARQLLSARLQRTEAKLHSVTGSLGWRLLRPYGAIKQWAGIGSQGSEDSGQGSEGSEQEPVGRGQGSGVGGRRSAGRGQRAVGTQGPVGSGQGAGVGKPESGVGAERPVGERLAAPSAYDVICFPIIDWEFRFQRPQQLCSQFARDGHRVFYLRTTFSGSGESALIGEITEDVYDVELPGPLDLNLYQDEIDSAVLSGFMESLYELRRRARIIDAVLLVQLPFWAPVALAARERWGWKTVYDCMDEHSGFSNNKPLMLGKEQELLACSDLVVTTSASLFERASAVARRTLQVPNACDFEHFNLERFNSVGRADSLPRPLASVTHPIIGYYGAISDWFDVGMVRDAARARPDWQFVLIGHTFGADVSPLKRLRNVHLLGEQPYSDLPAYLHEFDVACIPFLITPLTRATNPVKFYEYLSAGKPVVAVELPELEQYRGYFYPVGTAGDFVSQIEAALSNHSAEKARRGIELAIRNTWTDRYSALSDSITELYPKAAVIVVSYKNLDYLRYCLESLWTRTLYPNFEVIVVDNGGEPGILEYLRATAASEPRLKLVLNGENLGFARANNIGIEAAGGCEYVVLLNDDTIVTRGWLGRIIEYLKDDRIGLVGPVTNWAGNEARIEVDYRGPDGLDQFAERYTEEHADECFDIRVLAMFCLGMRRRLVDEVGLLDERFGVGMFEDDDFSLRVQRAGYRVICAEDIYIHHWGRASFSRMEQIEYYALFEENRRKFEEKWGQRWQPHKYRSAGSNGA